MKIKWILEDRELPTLGLIKNGQVRDVEDSLGQALIKQGAASAVATKKSKED